MDAALARLEDALQRGDVAALVAELRALGGSPAHAPVALRACKACSHSLIHLRTAPRRLPQAPLGRCCTRFARTAQTQPFRRKRWVRLWPSLLSLRTNWRQ
jgi:hypothetical protein